MQRIQMYSELFISAKLKLDQTIYQTGGMRTNDPFSVYLAPPKFQVRKHFEAC